MKKYLFTAAFLLATLAGAAQETYENAKIVGEDLNGTARYVGMGGAMDALGADISTIGTNPAGLGLFRRSAANVSFGLVSQQDGEDFAEGKKTNMSFDQAGFVWAVKTGSNNFLNFAFNYHKSRNFDYILSAADRLNDASQNKLTYVKQYEGLLFPANSSGVPDNEHPYASCSQLDYMYADNLNYSADDNMWYYDPATEYTLDRAHKGYIGEYDFALAGNHRDRIYWGLTLGIHDVNYKHYGEYREQLDGFGLTVADDRKIDGTGVDVKAGIIFRPVEASPFRIGLSVATPTWYDLTTTNYTSITDGSATASGGESYDFKLYTPWKFGVSLGHTVGNYLALGASYEFADYGSLDTRYETGGYYDYWDGYYTTSASDDVMNRHTEQTLKGVSTLKLGAEYRPIPELALRVGYNYVSPMYEKDGFKDGTLQTDGSYYSSATDYTNWEATNRFTCGLGYNIGQLSLDFAYQYSAQKGKFSPFMSYENTADHTMNNIADAVDVSNKRHQVLFTLGY
ncbi:MAG: hemin receptor, partial [Prevotella sp.]|nr:hemin receptor [Prevotella sp.]